MATRIVRTSFSKEAGQPAAAGDLKAAPEQDLRASRRALVVLGMHRSGTSALTRVLGLSGAALPSNLLPAEDGLPGDGNTKAGFWESKSLMLLHEEALASAGSKWDDLCDLPPSWFESEIAKDIASRLTETVTAEFGDAPIFVAKDPRISRLVPLWDTALEKLEIEANWLIPVRNPLDVAASLNRRDGFPQPKGLLLWLAYFLAAERHTRHQKRLFVFYDHLLDDWRGVLSRIRTHFDLSLPRRSYRAEAEIDDFLDHSLRHHATGAGEVAVRDDIAGWIKDAFRWASRAVAGKPESSEVLDEIHRSLRQAELLFGPVLSGAERENQVRQEKESELEREIDTLRRATAETEGLRLSGQQIEKEAAEIQGRLRQEIVQLRDDLAKRGQNLGEAEKELEESRRATEERREEAAQEEARLRQELVKNRDELVERDQSLVDANMELKDLLRSARQRQEEADKDEGGLRKKIEELDQRLTKTATSLNRPAPAAGSTRVKTLAFFLPQYHPIPENDEWWGAGFTEWTNVTRAEPAFRGHQQPLLPSELGFYDLRISEIRSQQAELAREHGIHGFCYYYYWFHGKKLLQRPLEDMLTSGEPDFPFCLCWANENWTRRWDGEDQEILIAQEHSPESDARFIDDIMPALLDPRYIRQNGKPVLLVYRADLLADALATTAIWRKAARRSGLPGLHLCAVWQVDKPLDIGFDALVEFPPHHLWHKEITDQVESRVEGFEGKVFDYSAAVDAVQPLKDRGFPVYRGVMPSWDNSARRGKRAWIFAGSTPERFADWLGKVVRESGDRPGMDDQFVFINAWNEWAEGAVLEPSRVHGRGYLKATKSVLHEATDVRARLGGLEKGIMTQLAQLRDGFAAMDQRQQRTEAWIEDSGPIFEAHETALKWLRDCGSASEEKHADEINRLRQSMESERETRERLLEELKVEITEVHRQGLASRMRSPGRELWLSSDFGVLGLILKFPLWLFSFRLPTRWNWWRETRRIFRSGLFDADYYRGEYTDVSDQDSPPLYHYVRYGAAEGRNPNRAFNASRYSERNPEVADSKANALLHYLEVGAGDVDPVYAAPSQESAAIGVEDPPERTPRWTLNENQLAKRGAKNRRLLFVSHDAARAGSQIYLLEVLKSFSRLPDLELFLLTRRGGELREDFERYAHVFDVDEHRRPEESEERVIVDALEAIGEAPGLAVCNTVASGEVARILKGLGVPVISIVHELPTTIESLGEQTIRDTVSSSKSVIVVSEFVRKALIERYDLPADRLKVVYVGVTGWRPEVELREAARRGVLERHGLPEDAVLVLGCGSIHHRKGTDLFVQVARDGIVNHGLDRAFFIWVGGDENGPLFRSWCEHDIATFGLRDRILFTGQQDSAVDYYLAADVFLLTSREDPFPLVNLEALARGLPIVAFRDAGGAQEALDDGAGILVPYLNTAEMTRALVRLVEAPRYRASVGKQARERALERYRWDRFIAELRELVARHMAPERIAEAGQRPSIS